ncbi:ATP phosphoribosyltransferase [Thermanaerovibrio acidaminovorans DSM 6589]|uniref:ATP phosphoribosyltransferase n=1 Tax=Thermanaerovibrio acidaminovorans (strain ATCC 49978 / DSM 6589 / Su883) TaxID=525903 RepID=D1B863_THEAS|nr:ATP phosphoribosyltransferase [Thermanaerovibrio acidaminovorans]ACZ18466.1 ATP phosphoribosyltransferase [Thermanaerovibrio acidaminovorans DSM 6589]
MLTMAIPTGRSMEDAAELLTKADILPPDTDPGRRLEIPLRDMRIILVKPQDVPPLVHMGFAQLGLAGQDVILESGARVAVLHDTGLCPCRMVIAGPPKAREGLMNSPNRKLRVATKYVRTADQVLPQRGLRTVTVPLHGSVEIAPALGIAEVIMDIVQTGNTLKANGLSVLMELFPVTMRLIANPGALNLQWDRIRPMLERIREVSG